MSPRRPPPRNVRPADDDTPHAGPRTAPPPRAGAAEADGRSLRRGLRVLDALRQAGDQGLRVVELCRTCELPRAPVYRLLATLVDLGHVLPRGRYHYRAGPRWSVAPAVADAAPPPTPGSLAERLQPVLAQVSAGCGDAAFAVVREGHSAWCIARHVGTNPVQILAVQVGSRQPLGVGAAGLALLAALPVPEADAAIASHGTVLERYGGMTPARLQILVKATRERGWSVVGNHAAKGALGVGMAVCDRLGRPVAAISVASAMDRMTRPHQQTIARLMREALAGFVLPGPA